VTHRTNGPVLGLIVSFGLVLSACGSGSPASPSVAQTSASATASSASASAETSPNTPSARASNASGGAEASDAAFACTTVHGDATAARAQLSDVRLGTGDDYDRLTFQFTGGLPAYTIESATPPFARDASGAPLEVSGSSFLRITLHGGTKQLPDGGTSYNGPTELRPGLPNILHVVEAGDYEAVSTWYVGLASSSCFRVWVLGSSSRLAIDAQH
jgi:hypothetical protein